MPAIIVRRGRRKNVPVPHIVTKRGMRRGLIVTVVVLLLLIAGAAKLLSRARAQYRAEIVRLRGSMTDLERARADAVVAGERSRLRMAIELARRQARIEPELHLSVALESNAMTLEREGAVLRSMPVEIGADRRIGVAPDTVRLAAPRGARTVARVLDSTATWEVPAWVFHDRGLPLPERRSLTGALGVVALLLDGGTIIYALPTAGPLSDSAYVLPGSARARSSDLRAIAPNLRPGMRVYFY
jgi:hypothetical protein